MWARPYGPRLAFRASQMHQAQIFRPLDVRLAVSDVLPSTPTTLSVREVVIYFKFHENRSRGLGAVGDRKSPYPIDLAHRYPSTLILYNSLYSIYSTSRNDIIKRKQTIHRHAHN